ncbi:MAG: hydantoinase/oxoprolinase family protein [Actinobacteria bacterium]|nr:hydantoinase/oxoprolinase family protein [Actinomycetota bacterium]
MDRAFVIGTDIGGTFTDICVIDEQGSLIMDKVPTTPHDFSLGVENAIQRLAEIVDVEVGQVLDSTKSFKHGSTVSTNALITRDGAKVGLLTTAGFEDTTVIMRGIGRVAGLDESAMKHQSACTKPEPIVPRHLIKGITERVDFAGRVVVPLNETELEAAVVQLVEVERVEALAISFLWSFMNPSHEHRAREIVERRYGADRLYVSISSELCPVIREYARTNTVILNSYLGKKVGEYTTRLQERLKSNTYQRPILLMQSNGGVVTADKITPIGTVGSGPCGGMIGAKYLADVMGHSQVITTDMGGTSFDVGLLVDGFWRYAREPVYERFHISIPMIEIESIGAGGGTIASVDPVTKRLKVGPKSAGADPGPVCYGGRNVDPTVTDADLVLGYLDPDYFLGGRMPLRKDRAEAAIAEKIAAPLGIGLIEAAAGLHEVINGQMADLIRKKVVSTGHVPEEFVVYAFGGAGPVHATGYTTDLGIAETYVFPTSAVFSAFGIATADIVHTLQKSHKCALPGDPDPVNELVGGMEAELRHVAEAEGLDPATVQFRRSFFIRYKGQLNELCILVPTMEYGTEDLQGVVKSFEQTYDRVYGSESLSTSAGVELISVSIDVIAPTPKPVLAEFAYTQEEPAAEARKPSRDCYFLAERSFVPTSIYDYVRLQTGNVVRGPAIVESPITTVVVPPGVTAQMGSFHELRLVHS